MPMSVNSAALYPLSLFAFLPSLWASVLISLLTMWMVEILSKLFFFLRGTFYTEKRHGIILYWVIRMPHVNFVNVKN